MTCHHFNKHYNKITCLLFADIFVFSFNSVRCFKFTPGIWMDFEHNQTESCIEY